MNKAFEKILDRLEEMRKKSCIPDIKGYCQTTISRAKQIVREVSEEYNNGWIPCSERLPEENQQVILQDFYGNITIEKMKIADGIEGFIDGDWWSSANNYVAWQPLPEPFKERD